MTFDRGPGREAGFEPAEIKWVGAGAVVQRGSLVRGRDRSHCYDWQKCAATGDESEVSTWSGQETCEEECGMGPVPLATSLRAIVSNFLC